MKYRDLREFIDALEKRGDLVRIKTEVDPNLEMTEIADRTLRGGGPALLFENPKGYNTPVLANLFGTTKRVRLALKKRFQFHWERLGRTRRSARGAWSATLLHAAAQREASPFRGPKLPPPGRRGSSGHHT